MKLNCNVEVCNRLLPSARRKPQRSCLAIGRQSIKTNDLYILLQTQQNKQGVKYKIEGNIEKVFVKFIDDGKATIRLKDPQHDLNIQSDAVQLKSFMHVLKLGISKKVDPSILSISNLNPKNLSTPPKTKIIIKKDSDYPTLQGFPRTTEELHIVGLNRKSFDRHILKLQSLRVLNLSENQISLLPKELGTLPNLQELILSQNQLGKSPPSKWAWLNQSPLCNTLRLLDISSNLLSNLPQQIRKLSALVNLKLSQNMLTHLPQSIGNLPNLKYLDISKNSLTHLPGSMRNLQLLSLDISHNAFDNFKPFSMSKVSVPTLVECSAKSVLRERKRYNASMIPFTLVKFLDDAKYCVCGSACFDCYMRKSMQIDLSSICNSVRSSGNIAVRFDCFFCSLKCLQNYSKMQY